MLTAITPASASWDFVKDGGAEAEGAFVLQSGAFMDATCGCTNCSWAVTNALRTPARLFLSKRFFLSLSKIWIYWTKTP